MSQQTVEDRREPSMLLPFFVSADCVQLPPPCSLCAVIQQAPQMWITSSKPPARIMGDCACK